MKRCNGFLRALLIPFLFSLLLSPGVGAQVRKEVVEGLKLRKVALFKSGVGYFELSGRMETGKEVRLHFKQEQMNDLLKSLTVLKTGGGEVGSISYDSTKTVEQQLGDYAFDLKRGDGLPQVLGQLQGSRIELIVGSSSIAGTVVGVEKRVSMENRIKMPRFFLNLMDTDGYLRSFDTAEIGAVKFLDQRLNRDINRYLSVLAQTHLKDEKVLAITPTGTGAQDIRVSYVIEVPVWKATYRIIVPGDDDAKGKPFIQGWAIIDNVTAQDWEDIELSLISGLPISFVQDLYDPLFRKRPVVKMEREALPAPAVPEAGMKATLAAPSPPRKVQSSRRMEKLYAMAPMMKEEADRKSFDRNMRELKAETATRERGEMFEYRIAHPVTIRRNRSALVPIVATEIEGAAVDLYNRKTRPQNPLSAVRLKNDTGLTLEGGPLTVFQGGGYAGDALIKTFTPNEERYITYAVDLSIRVNTKTGTKREDIDRIVINRGVIRTHRSIIETMTYNIDNRGARPKTVVIEHPYHPDRKLLNEEKPVEITDNYLRFQVEAPAGKVTRFSVREVRDSWDRIWVSNLTPDQVAVYVSKNYLSETVKDKLQKIVALKSRIGQIERDLKAVDRERKEIFNDQKRLGENLRGLGQTTGEKTLRNRYVERLGQQETRLENLQRNEKELRRELRAKQKEMERMIGGLEQDLIVGGS